MFKNIFEDVANAKMGSSYIVGQKPLGQGIPLFTGTDLMKGINKKQLL